MGEEKKWTPCKTYSFMGLMLLTGTINTIANKLQQSCEYEGVYYRVHQKFITFCMFLGMTVCLIVYLIQELIKKKKSGNSAKTSIIVNAFLSKLTN